jgi:hypothetical protein
VRMKIISLIFTRFSYVSFIRNSVTEPLEKFLCKRLGIYLDDTHVCMRVWQCVRFGKSRDLR